MNFQETIDLLKQQANPRNVLGMARFGIRPKSEVLGVGMTRLRQMAKKMSKDHSLANALWRSGVHEARILAALIEEPSRVTRAQAKRWARSFDSWDICDTVCGSLFDKLPFVYELVGEWAKKDAEYVRRAAFATIAWLAVHDKKAPDAKLTRFLPLIERYSDDNRNFVRKAVNWALRQIGKRSPALRLKAIAAAKRIQKRGTKSARWIAADALRELSKPQRNRQLMMPFPDEYRIALKSGHKTMTIRVGAEVGQYEVGKSYRAVSYAGKDWGERVKVVSVQRARIDDLLKLGITAKDIKRVRKSANLDDRVNILRFKVMK